MNYACDESLFGSERREPVRIATPRVVAWRTDYFHIAYRVELARDVLDALRARAALAKKHGMASFECGKCVGTLKASHASGRWYIDTSDARVFVQEHAPGADTLPTGEKLPGWSVEVIFSGVNGCMYKTEDRMLFLGIELANSFGQVKEERLRRVDLCADVAGFKLSTDQPERFVKRPRAGFGDYAGRPDRNLHEAGVSLGSAVRAAERCASKENVEAVRLAKLELERQAHLVAVRSYEAELLMANEEPSQAMPRIHAARHITGFSICPGGDLMCRVYDKREELSLKEDHRTCEERRWNGRGWADLRASHPDYEHVTRVEFQIRGEALRDLGLRNPRAPFDPKTGARYISLIAALDAVWRYCIDWTRLVELPKDKPDFAVRLTRCHDAPEWRALHDACFADAREPRAGRTRLRRGATAEQTLGCMLSMMATRKLLELKDERPPYRSPDEVQEELFGELDGLWRYTAPVIAQELVKKRRGVYGALQHLNILSNAARARFVNAFEESRAEVAA